MTECNQDQLKETCACTYNCSRRGKCCECIQYHLSMDQLPGCVFAKISEEAEKTYDRSFEYFANLVKNR